MARAGPGRLVPCAMRMGGSMAGKGITYAGSLVADTFHFIEYYPQEGMQTHIVDTKHFVGGIGNNISQLAHIDPTIPIHVSAIAGLDEGGDRSIDMLSAYPNVDLSNVTREGESSMTLVMNSLESKQRTFFSRPSSSVKFNESYIDWDKLDCDIFHLEYLLALASCDADDEEYGTHAARILHDARQRGMRTSVDIVSKRNDRAHHIVSCALRYTDYCVIHEVETQIATGIDVMDGYAIDVGRATEALKQLASMGTTTWAVIHCSGMAVGYDCATGKVEAVQSLPIAREEILGTNGAGDAYNTGILYQAYKGSDLACAMRFAAATAGLSLLGENGYAALLPEQGIWDFEAERRAQA